MPTKLVCLSLICALTLACATTAKQAKVRPVTASEAISQLRSGQKIRVVTDAAIIEGRLGERTGDAFQMKFEGEIFTIPFPRVQSIEVRRTRAGQGARAGAIVLGISGLLFGLAVHGLCQGLDESEDPEGCPGFIAAGGLFGVTTGALLGGGLGALSRKWERIYP